MACLDILRPEGTIGGELGKYLAYIWAFSSVISYDGGWGLFGGVKGLL